MAENNTPDLDAAIKAAPFRCNPALMAQLDNSEPVVSDDELIDEAYRRRLITQGRHSTYQREYFNNRYGR